MYEGGRDKNTMTVTKDRNYERVKKLYWLLAFKSRYH